jgi:predicted ribosomally synthesized peptide with nif11-like leader
VFDYNTKIIKIKQNNMSIIKDFLAKVNGSQEFTSSYNSAKDLKEVSELAATLGFTISPAELQGYFQNENLDDSDLNNITGGTSMMGVSPAPHGGWYSGD